MFERTLLGHNILDVLPTNTLPELILLEIPLPPHRGEQGAYGKRKRDISDTLLKIFDIKQVFKDNDKKYIIYL
jgi:hypothetical protein